MLAEEKMNILLVDDMPSKILALESVLADLGQNIVKAKSGTEALRYLLQQDFAVILLDVNMPGMDGFETASLIRQRKNSEHTPIIFITAINTNETHVYRGYSLGAVDYIFTPVVPEVLKAKVAVFVDLAKKTQQIRVQAQELARSNRELEEFAYVASHDLQEPLRMVGSYTQLLAQHSKEHLDAEATEYVEVVIKSVKRMHALINDLLEYSRIGRRTKKLTSTNCEDVLQAVMFDLKSLVTETQAKITHDMLPSVMADNSKLYQLFQNLISNALKFHGNRPPKIHVSATLKDGEWIFSVRDNGIGIETCYFDRIFQVFQRLHSSREYPGTGIGLAICKKIAEFHGGRIWLDSEFGIGSTFYFAIPIEKSPLLNESQELAEMEVG